MKQKVEVLIYTAGSGIIRPLRPAFKTGVYTECRLTPPELARFHTLHINLYVLSRDINEPNTNWQRDKNILLRSPQIRCLIINELFFFLVYWGLTPQQQPGSYQGGEMMMMKSVIWWMKPEYPEETKGK